MNVFSRVSLFVSIVCCSSLSVWAQQTVSVNVKADVKPISPLIYGANNPTSLATAVRWGGNRTSAYNWENNYSNAGADYNHISDRFFLSNVNAQEQAIPAIPIIKMVKTANQRKQYTLVTLQAAGFVSADANGAVTEEQEAPSYRWDSVIFRKGAEFSLSPNKTDGKVYIDEMVNYLQVSLGKKGSGGIDAFAIDNEPALWGSTHPRIRPSKITLNELFYKTIQVGSLVKDIAPDTEVYGPMFFGWWDIYNFNNLGYPSGRGYTWFLDFYLDSLQNYEDNVGERVVDVLAVHWYPEAKGKVSKKRIVDLDGTISDTELIAQDMIEARLQSPRALWDSSYVEYGNINNISGSIHYLKRIQKSINTFNPKMKIAFTEFKYDAENHFSGGLALADVLGVFGKEGVYMASKWDPVNNDYGAAAYKLYVDYNNSGGKFGSTSVSAKTNDNSVLSSVASLDENNNLHIIVINKTDVVQSTNFDLQNGYYSHGEVFGFDKNSSTISQFTSINQITNSTFNYSLPAYSAIHIVLYALPQIEIVEAKIIEPQSNTIQVVFSSDVTIVDILEATNEFVITNQNNDELSINNISVVSNTSIAIVLNNAIADSIVYLSYNGNEITNVENIPIKSVQKLFVHNELIQSPLFLKDSYVNNDGKILFMHFSKPIQISNPVDFGIHLEVNNEIREIDSIKIYPNNYILAVYPSSRIIKHDTVIVSNNTIAIEAIDGTIPSYFADTLKNQGPNYSMQLDSIIIKDNFTFVVYYNQPIDVELFDNSNFELLNNQNKIELLNFSISNNVVTYTVELPLFKENEYTLSYVDNNNVVSVFNGYLDAFSNRVITNNLKSTPDYITIPSIVEAENYCYHSSKSVLETNTDGASGQHVGFINANDRFGYYIDVPESKNYTIQVRHSSFSQAGEIEFYVNGMYQTSLYIPITGSWNTWSNSAVVLPLSQGKQTIECKIKKSGYNFNYFEIIEGEFPSDGSIYTAQTDALGINIYLFYNRKFNTLPLESEFSIYANNTLLEIQDVTFFSNDSSKILITLDTVIYKGQELKINTNISSTQTTENGDFIEQNNIQIQNKSSVIQNSISSFENSYKINVRGSSVIIDVLHNTNVDIQILNIVGQQLFYDYNVKGAKQYNLQQGIYLIHIIEDSNTYAKKITIE